ncbi:hypothetical protein AYO21_12045 [Fonsecaea monophora]|uniref:Uncharacterized protein n=1 Tax=Fonsecaea monophora TaxID=254056 RepID=A0A177ERD5_9EURO|nr:hypothetical protein AYO21_12045 [Fonsecaea monophora]KAH0833634.1 hypothetical protein FOPE_03281 [Fonsecaea pedrosoi]OAG33850.1 hypothetical protein AYO21_12045 [Fonsecaea monophora]
MSGVVRSITSTKRKTTPAPTAARKRQRPNGTEITSSARPSKSQRTLTQVEWISTFSPSFDDRDMQYLDDVKKPSPAPKRPRPRAQKPDSTLTQMDFFDSTPRDYQDIDDTMIDDSKWERDNYIVPQLDGTYDSPRRPRKRKATPKTISLPGQEIEPSNQDSQAEYRPRKRKKKVGFADNGSAEATRRSSKRLAIKDEVLSDPVKNFDYFAQALTDQVEDRKHHFADESLDRPLEIEDSADEMEITSDTVLGKQDSALPETPKRKTNVVLSSQSPESLCESTHKSNRKTPETLSTLRRAPLAERSVNIPPEASPTRKEMNRSRTPRRGSTKSKVIVLKLPKRDQLRRPARIEDSQVNLWSIPSSSPEFTRPATTVQAPTTSNKTTEDFEIPPTSQLQGSGLTTLVSWSEDNLTNLSQLFASRSGGSRGDIAVDSLQEENQSVIVRDFADAHSPPTKSSAPGLDCFIRSSSPVLAETQDPNEHARESLEEICDAADFGSPIANDTQFNIQILHRVSSPIRPEQFPGQSDAGSNAVLSSAPPPNGCNGASKEGEAPHSGGPDIDHVQPSDSPLLIPTLLGGCSADAEGEAPEIQDEEAEEVPLPKPVFVHPASTHWKMAKAPRSDNLHTSSPTLSFGRHATQRSVYPASIPHPSQISTQDVTQGFLPQSSLPQLPQEGLLEGEPEKISIKDSSSLSIPLSQIPQHVGPEESQLNGNINAAQESSSEDDFDLDLDPPSLPVQPSRAPAALLQQHTEQLMAHKVRSGTPTLIKDSHVFKCEESLQCSQTKETQSGPESTAAHSPEPSLPSSPERLAPLQKQYSPIPGFDNDTQSNFTQNGHVTAAYIHRQRESGIFPKWFVPTPFQVPGYTRRK